MQLDGGVQVVGLRDGEPRLEGALRIWDHFRGDKVTLRVLEMDSGGRAELYNADQEEVLYHFGGDVSIHLPVRHELALDGAMTMISVRTPSTPSAATAAMETAVVSLDERPLQRTGDRWYRELIEGEVTQFVGIIPPGRAPEHYHLYEEVLCILDGEGMMWAGASSAPIATGSCIYLPKGQRHCVENTSSRDLRLLGVFYPAGSPAVRYS